MKKLLALFFLLAHGALLAAEPAGYYNAANGLSGTALRAALHGIIDHHTVISYNATRDALENLDEDPANSANLILIYERTSWPKSAFVSGNTGWNREHCWPNSLGIDGDLPAYSDLFNLRACGVQPNSDRGNLAYDESSFGPAFGHENPAHPQALLCTQDDDSWEPAPEVKGDLARAMFYMDVRYEGDPSEPNLALTDNLAVVNSTNANMGRLTTLLLWHFIDPVSAAERARCEKVYGYQRNRNPFVDHPEWVEAIYGAVFSLTATRSGNQLQLTWPAMLPADLAFIETSTDLATWPAATLTITPSGGQKTATVPLSPAPRYYRLKLSPRAG